MTVVAAVAVAGAGALGALVRHELTTDRPLAALHVVNVVGSLVLGLALGAGVGHDPIGLALATGGLGAATSFSTWVVGARHATAAQDGHSRWLGLAGHLLLPALLAVLAAGAGWWVGGSLVAGTSV